MPVLDRDEYVEQAFFFEAAEERLKRGDAMQEVLRTIKDEVLATTRLPMALDYLLAELNHVGTMSGAMSKLSHYFTAYQTYIVKESEDDRGRFDLRTGFRILAKEAIYKSEGCSTVGLFLFQFECLCRNRLRYDYGLAAIAQDPSYDKVWATWVMEVRRRIESIGIADLVYVASEHYVTRERQRLGEDVFERPELVLFGEREGKIALANRSKEPIYLFEALQRQLGYPKAPRNLPKHDPMDAVPQLLRRMERLEQRVKLLEDENREGSIDLSKFYRPKEE